MLQRELWSFDCRRDYPPSFLHTRQLVEGERTNGEEGKGSREGSTVSVDRTFLAVKNESSSSCWLQIRVMVNCRAHSSLFPVTYISDWYQKKDEMERNEQKREEEMSFVIPMSVSILERTPCIMGPRT